MKAGVRFALAATLLFAIEASAAEHYVRQGAAGNGSGTDWTNAYSSLPATLTRGDTYYVAEGTYSGYTFDDPTSGTTLITIKKATTADHGTSVGWSNGFGDSVAVFTGPFRFATSYWLVDGVVGGGPGSWTSGFGFRVSVTSANPLIEVLSSSADFVTVRHVDLQGNSNSSGGGSIAQDAVAIRGGSNFTLSYYYTHALGRCPFFLVPAPDSVFEFGYIGKFVSTEAAHSEVISAWNWSAAGHLTFRYNVVTHITGTGGIMWDNSGNRANQARIYGNVFYRALTDTSWNNNANGLIGGWSGGGGEDCFGLRVFNNTFININGTLIFTSFITRSGDNQVRNNIFYNSIAPEYADIQTNDYNHYINSGGTQGEPNGTSAASGDPFVDMVNLDFRLKAPTVAGATLAAPYNVDPYGTVRGADGLWDRGAAEGGASGGAPTAPTNLRITN